MFLWWTLFQLRSQAANYGAKTRLAGSKDPRVVRALIGILGDPREKDDTRADAAEILGNIGNPLPVEALISALAQDSSWIARKRAADALQKIDPRRARHVFAARLREGEGDVTVLSHLAAHFIRAGDEGRPVLLAALKDPRHVVRHAVILAVRDTQSAACDDLLVEGLKDTDDRVRVSSIDALASVAKQRQGGVAPLVACIAAIESSKDVPEGAKSAFDKLPTAWWKSADARGLLPYLLEKLGSDSSKSAAGAAEALARIGDPGARKALLDFLFGPRNARRPNDMALAGGFDAAARALDAIEPGWRQSETWQTHIPEYLRLVAREDEAAHPNVLCALDPNWEKWPEMRVAMPHFEATLRADKEKYHRVRAAFYLGNTGDRVAVDALLAALRNDADAEVRKAARDGLGRILLPEELSQRLAEVEAPATAKAAAPAPRAAVSTSAQTGVSERWKAIFKADIMQFLTSPRTREREQRTGDWWSQDNLKLVATKSYMHELPPEVLFPTADQAIEELAREGRIVGTASGYRAK